MGVKNNKIRILQLLKILHQKTDEEHPLSAQELISLLEQNGTSCDRKTIYEDVEALTLCGYDVLKTRTPKNGYFLANRDFELPEVALLTDAVLAADFITKKKTAQLVKKLKGLLNVYQAEAYAHRTFIDNRNKADNEEIYYNIDAIERGLQEKKKLRLTYLRHTLQEGKHLAIQPKELTVSPYALIWADDHYYLIGNYEKYDNLLHLRLDRMKSVTVTEEDYRPFFEVSEYRDEFNVADYAAKAFHMFSGEQTEITLDCDNGILEQVIDRFSDRIYIRENGEGRFLFGCNAFVSDGLAAWIMQFGDKMRVERPAELQERIIAMATAVLKNYSDGESGR